MLSIHSFPFPISELSDVKKPNIPPTMSVFIEPELIKGTSKLTSTPTILKPEG